MNLDTQQGLEIPTMAQVIQAFVAGVQANFDPTFAIENSNLLSQIIVIVSQVLSNQFDTLQACFDVLDPQSATGQNLIDACQYVGVQKGLPLPTAVYLLLNVTAPLTVPANTSLTEGDYTITNPIAYAVSQTACSQCSIKVLNAIDSTTYSFELNDTLIAYIADPDDTPITIAAALNSLVPIAAPLFTSQVDPDDNTQIIINALTGGIIDYSVPFAVVIDTPAGLSLTEFSGLGQFLNSVDGNISIPAGTFTLSSTPVVGLTTTQFDDGINGQDAETDQALRIKRDLSLAIGGNRTIAAIRSQLLRTLYVQKAVVYQNTSDEIVELDTGIDLLPHSIYAVVLGGYKVDIGTAIYNKMSEGIQTNGATPVVLFDDYLNYILINFDYATQIPVAINIAVIIDKSLYYKIDKNAVANIQNEVFAYIQGLNIGEIMYMLSIQGVVGCAIQFGIKAISVNYYLLPATTPIILDLIPLKNAIVVADISNINVTVVAE